MYTNDKTAATQKIKQLYTKDKTAVYKGKTVVHLGKKKCKES